MIKTNTEIPLQFPDDIAGELLVGVVLKAGLPRCQVLSGRGMDPSQFRGVSMPVGWPHCLEGEEVVGVRIAHGVCGEIDDPVNPGRGPIHATDIYYSALTNQYMCIAVSYATVELATQA